MSPESVPSARHAGGLVGTLVVAVAVIWGGGQLTSADDGAMVFGSRTITVAPGDDRVAPGVLFDAADVVVPDGVRVVQDGMVVFGSVDCGVACAANGPRQITVDASGAFGSVDIRTRSEAAAAAAEDAAEDAD